MAHTEAWLCLCEDCAAVLAVAPDEMDPGDYTPCDECGSFNVYTDSGGFDDVAEPQEHTDGYVSADDWEEVVSKLDAMVGDASEQTQQRASELMGMEKNREAWEEIAAFLETNEK